MARIVKDPEVRRAEIIQAAQELFESQGFEETTMRDVMEKVEIAKGTIYHYFKSKDELFEAVVHKLVDDDIAEKHSILEKISGSALDKIRVLTAAGNLAEQQTQIIDALHKPGNRGIHTQLLAVTISKQSEIYGDLIRQGVEEGLFETEHPLEAAEFIMTGLQFLTDEGIYPWRPESLMRRAGAFPELIEAMLHAPKGSFNFLVE